ncbi:hypothetical protein JCM9279_003953 [Rhodotorula babjevae]
MSARARSARKSTTSTFSYAEVPSSADEDEGSELDDQDRGGGGRKSKIKAPTKRRKSKAKAVEVDSGDEGDEDDQPRKKARKPAKGKQSKQKKGTGKLEILKTLPIEMLTEIFSHLYSNDLLALSMVNKQYRALLTAKSSTYIWKAARDKLELPDVVTEHFSEIHYATLIFGRECQVCMAGKYVSLEPRLRLRICKSCRNQQLVKLSALKRTHPDVLAKLHPRAQDAVLDSRGYVLLNDLHRATVILRDLEDQDEDDYIAEGNVALVHEPSPPPPSSSRRRSSRPHSSKSSTPRYQDEDDSEDNSTSPFTRRVNEYVDARSGLSKEVSKHAHSIVKAYQLVKKHRQQLGYESYRARYEASRADKLRKKVMSLGLGYTWRSFGASWSRNKLVKSTDPLTNDEWERIKPELLALLDRNDERQRKKTKLYQDKLAQHQRQRDLRPRYDALLKSMPRSARPFAPLYLDFLLFPSVKPLWVGDSGLSEQAWLDALDDIKDEVEQFRLDLVAHAHSIVLEATIDPDVNPCSLDDDELPADLDNFFSRATSLICCDRPYCEPPQKYSWPYHNVRDEYRNFNSIGPLISVLEHLHEHHNYDTEIYEFRAREQQQPFHITLPLEVACAVTAILEVNQLDPSTAGVAELERAERGVRNYVWDNHRPTRRIFTDERAWFDVLHAVKKDGEKLARLKPPVYLDPPVIVMHPVPGYRAPAADEDDEQEQLDEED